MIENTVIITVLCSALLYLFLVPKKENYKPMSNRTTTTYYKSNTISGDIINIVRERLCKIFNKKYIFTGVLTPLNNRNIMQEIKLDEGTKSFTINKKNVFLCLNDKHGKYYDINSLMYVALHEISHVICTEIGHTALFTKIFKSILQHASNLNLYDPSKPFIKNYCP